jgi:hypothetical protein
MDYDRPLGALSCGGIAPALRGGAMSIALIVLTVLSGCARTRLVDGQLRPAGTPTDATPAGEGGGGAGSGAAPSAGTPGIVDPGPTGAGTGPAPTAGRGDPGVPGGTAGTAGAPETAGRPAPPTGTAGMPGEFDPSNVLNPQRCASEHPFVLSIDPGGNSGEVQGWLESAPAVVFDRFSLPRFGLQTTPDEEADGELTLWWSIAELGANGDGALWFYAGNGATEVAHVAASRPAAIGDASTLHYASWSVGPVKVGEIAVFHHLPTDRYLAVRVVDLYGTDDRDRREICAAIDARWLFAPNGGPIFSIID